MKEFYSQLKAYAKKHHVIECIVKPYDDYQQFDSNGNPLSETNEELIALLTSLGFQHDGFKIGYPEGEPVWHYVKNLEGITPSQLSQSFSKKESITQKSKHFWHYVTFSQPR